MLILHTGRHEKKPVRIQSIWQMNSKERQTDLHVIYLWAGVGTWFFKCPLTNSAVIFLSYLMFLFLPLLCRMQTSGGHLPVTVTVPVRLAELICALSPDVYSSYSILAEDCIQQCTF